MQTSRNSYDAIVIGSGPNGLSAAITIAQAGHSVLVLEGKDTIGGGARSAELTLPGFMHDVCSTAHPTGLWSPFFRGLPLEKYGLEWVHPSAPMAHPLDDGSAVVLERSLEQTAANLGGDSARYVNWMGPLVSNWPKLEKTVLHPFSFPDHPCAAARFGLATVRSASGLARSVFREERGRALLAGLAAHTVLPLEQIPSAVVGVTIGIIAHTGGWPFARGGSQKIADALAAHLQTLGGEIVTSASVRSLDELPAARAILCDVTPAQLLRIAGTRFPANFRQQLERFRYAPGACKLDWALDGPIPWTAGECLRAGTVHVGGTLEEIAASERAAWEGALPEKPFVLLAQPTLFDETRAPDGKHIAWAYCHVPNGSNTDMTERIENQIERFAPGFRTRILKRSLRVATTLEEHNPNLVGGDVGGGALTLKQFFTRPTSRRYHTPARGVYICSSSTPPGGGVHGLCGHMAAQAALDDLF